MRGILTHRNLHAIQDEEQRLELFLHVKCLERKLTEEYYLKQPWSYIGCYGEGCSCCDSQPRSSHAYSLEGPLPSPCGYTGAP